MSDILAKTKSRLAEIFIVSEGEVKPRQKPIEPWPPKLTWEEYQQFCKSRNEISKYEDWYGLWGPGDGVA